MESRERCGSTWPKPCEYHEGWADALEQAEKEKASLRSENRTLHRILDLWQEHVTRVADDLKAYVAEPDPAPSLVETTDSDWAASKEKAWRRSGEMRP